MKELWLSHQALDIKQLARLVTDGDILTGTTKRLLKGDCKKGVGSVELLDMRQPSPNAVCHTVLSLQLHG